MILRDLRSYKQLLSGYTELRVQENRSINIALVKGNISSNSRSSSSGVSARVFKNGCWGFASNPDMSEESLKSVIKAATDNAGFLDSKQNKQKNPLPVTCASSINDFSTKKPRGEQKELIEFVREIDNYITMKYPGLSSRTVSLSCLDMEKTLLTSEGSHSHSMIPRAFIYCSMSVEKDSKPIEVSDLYGGLGQFEDRFDSPVSLFDKIDSQYEHLMRKKEGVHAEAGPKTCILDAELAGILAHEAIGHTTEADLVMGGSIARDYIGREIASPMVSIIDFANTAFGSICPVPVYVDDEGTRAEDVVIIENGVLRNFMHNKESANHFNTMPLGNARAFRFSDEPLIRMRNTAIVPGTSKLEDMIASIDDGYYLIRPSNGQADSTSEFMFGVSLGYEIKNGKLGRAILDTTISGIAYDVLKTVTMISDEVKWLSGGMCGKKQPIPVGLGGPAIRCRINIGGR